MASISKRVSGEWQNTSYGIRSTATDTITTLPTTIYSDGTNATVSIKGNTTQNGTPTPENPVMPQGTGERTGNLLDVYQNLQGLKDVTVNHVRFQFINQSIVLSQTSNGIYPQQQIWGENGVLNLKTKAYYGQLFVENAPENANIYILVQASNDNFQTYTTIATISTVGSTFTPPDDFAAYRYVFVCQGAGITYDNTTVRISIVEGSTAPSSHEPYGYKIPISSANTTTHVYLGELESIRQIKKMVITGTETITEESANVYSIPIADTVTTGAGLSTHFEYDSTVSAGQFRIEAGKAVFGYNDTLANFSTFLAAQNAAGTPVTIWYVLATPTTGIVNEPLMKIGDYADTLSNISIPVAAGGDTLSVGTTVQPSEVTVNYKGWHPVQSVHEYDSNYTIATMQALTIAQLQTHTISDLQGGGWS